MNKNQAAIQTGGRFIVEPIGTEPIFTREQFSEEHLEIERMVREFARETFTPIKNPSKLRIKTSYTNCSGRRGSWVYCP